MSVNLSAINDSRSEADAAAQRRETDVRKSALRKAQRMQQIRLDDARFFAARVALAERRSLQRALAAPSTGSTLPFEVEPDGTEALVRQVMALGIGRSEVGPEPAATAAARASTGFAAAPGQEDAVDAGTHATAAFREADAASADTPPLHKHATASRSPALGSALAEIRTVREAVRTLRAIAAKRDDAPVADGQGQPGSAARTPAPAPAEAASGAGAVVRIGVDVQAGVGPFAKVDARTSDTAATDSSASEHARAGASAAAKSVDLPQGAPSGTPPADRLAAAEPGRSLSAEATPPQPATAVRRNAPAEFGGASASAAATPTAPIVSMPFAIVNAGGPAPSDGTPEAADRGRQADAIELPKPEAEPAAMTIAGAGSNSALGARLDFIEAYYADAMVGVEDLDELSEALAIARHELEAIEAESAETIALQAEIASPGLNAAVTQASPIASALKASAETTVEAASSRSQRLERVVDLAVSGIALGMPSAALLQQIGLFVQTVPRTPGAAVQPQARLAAERVAPGSIKVDLAKAACAALQEAHDALVPDDERRALLEPLLCGGGAGAERRGVREGAGVVEFAPGQLQARAQQAASDARLAGDTAPLMALRSI